MRLIPAVLLQGSAIPYFLLSKLDIYRSWIAPMDLPVNITKLLSCLPIMGLIPYVLLQGRAIPNFFLREPNICLRWRVAVNILIFLGIKSCRLRRMSKISSFGRKRGMADGDLADSVCELCRCNCDTNYKMPNIV